MSELVPGRMVEVGGLVALAEQRHQFMTTIAATRAVNGPVAHASVTAPDSGTWTITLGVPLNKDPGR